jgi:class 3 adenylate cyclase
VTTETVTVLFTDLVDSTKLLSSVGDERMDALRARHDVVLRSAVAAANGTEVKGLGDGLMVVFPSAIDAFNCAVAMQQGIHRLNREVDDGSIAIRVGIAAGDVTVEADDYFGTPVVEAARLCAKAATSAIYVTELTRLLARSRGDHTLTLVGELELKGLTEPVVAYELGWEVPGDEDATTSGGTMPFPAALTQRIAHSMCVGRSEEKEVLAHASKAAESAGRQVVVVGGEPGVGKTTLTTHMARRAHRDGAIVAFGRCDEHYAGAYQPFAEALRGLIEHLPIALLQDHVDVFGSALNRLVPDLRRRLPDLVVTRSDDAEAERVLLFDACRDILHRVTQLAPVLLMLDDLQWANPPTLALFRQIVGATEGDRLLIIGTYRTTDLTRNHPLTPVLADLRRIDGAQRLVLRGLAAGEVVELMEKLAGHELDDDGLELAKRIHHETQGSPFFTVEILRHLRETGGIVVDDGRWRVAGELTIPDSIREVVDRRIDLLGEDSRTLLSMAALLGADFSPDVLLRVSEVSEDDVLDALEAAVSAGVLEERRDRLAFRHALLRTTLVDGLSALRRQRLHRRIAEALEVLVESGTQVAAAELAHHWQAVTQAADQTRALRYTIAAGDDALEALEFEEATRYFDQASSMLADQPNASAADRFELLLRVSAASRASGGDFRAVLWEAVELARQEGRGEWLARATLAWARLVLWSSSAGVDQGYIDLIQEALDALADNDPALRARLLTQLAVELAWSPDIDRRLVAADAGVAAARSVGDDEILLVALIGRGVARNVPHHWAGRMADSVAALSLADRIGNDDLRFRALWLHLLAVLEGGDFDTASARAPELTALASRRRVDQYRWLAELFDFILAGLAGHATAEDSTAIFERAAATGNADAFDAWAIQSLVLARDHGGLADLLPIIAAQVEASPLEAWRAALATVATFSGELDVAREAFATFADAEWDINRDAVWLAVETALAEIAVELGEAEAARVLYERLRPFTEHVGIASGAIGFGSAAYAVARAAAFLGDATAEAQLRTALDANRRVGDGPWRVRAQVALARFLASRDAADDRVEAKELAAQARTAAVGMDLPYELARLDILLAELA